MLEIRRARLIVLVLLVLVVATSPVSAHGPDDRGTNPDAPRGIPEAEQSEQTASWGCPMCETVRTDSPGDCPICRMALVRLQFEWEAEVGSAGQDAALGESGTDRRAALMPGVPDSLFYTAALIILVFSFVLFEVWGRRSAEQTKVGQRRDLLRFPALRRAVQHPWFVRAIQLPILMIFGLIMFAGLFGNQAPERNIAPALTWTFWWTWLALVIVFLGKAWCTVCPWMAIADLCSKIGRLWGNGSTPGLGHRWPRRLRNIWLATILFLFLTWLELGFGVTEKPWLTAVLGLAMVLACIVTVLIFERKAFCRYACLVGRVSGLYSMFSASELRATDRKVCAECKTRDCFHGNADGDACPTHQFMGSMTENTYCTMCLECVKTCPSDNVSWNTRPFGADLVESKRVRVDEAYLSVILLSMSAFHGFSMTPAWDTLVARIQGITGLGWLAAFSIGMTTMILLPMLIYAGICGLMKWMARDREHSTRYLFIRFSYSLLPIALFYHLAHNLQHIFFEGKKLIRAASDPFGWGWDLFGTANNLVDAMLPLNVGWTLQVMLIVTGHIFGIFIAHKAAYALYGKGAQATLSQIPMLAAMLLFSFQSLWLIAQPMVMRTAM